jgi:hypothetical protein
MRKQISLSFTFVLLLIAVACNAQLKDQFDDWGKVSMDDLKITEAVHGIESIISYFTECFI